MHAYANAIHDPSHEPGHFQLDVVVAGHARRHGLGPQLLAAVERLALGHGATHLGAVVPPGHEAGLAFAARHGYAVERMMFQSFLDPADADPVVLAGVSRQRGPTAVNPAVSRLPP